ncbi:hypothetical protein [Naasia aerilata]|uniref:Right handed beta helix domain-containing protein n=1 Tax=Naasia aerilata TaxID=1162966 RepID=A0ABM8GCJ5_9MICO|nr:hypothetical protein [Naasia aerilata]BDZ45941.1 hypothetical protein GCM10025866_18500 [Naasia aerilata]
MLASSTLALPSSNSIAVGIDQHAAAVLRSAERQKQKQETWRAEQAAARELAERKAAEEAARVAAEQAAQAAAATAAAAGASGSSGSGSGESGSGGSDGSGGSGSSGGGRSAFDAGAPDIARTVVNGDITVTQVGSVLDALDVHGRIIVKAANVTISNSIVRGLDSGSKYGLVDNMSGSPGLRIYDTEIAATNPNWTVNGIMGWNFELYRVNIHNTVDQVSIVGGSVVVADSWLHGNVWYADDPDHSDGSHADNIEIIGGDGISITGNTMTDATNSAIQITQDRSRVSNVRIAGNRMDNGDCMINISEKGQGSIAGISVTDNSFGLSGSISHCAVVGPTSTSVALGGNSFDDGALVTVKNG